MNQEKGKRDMRARELERQLKEVLEELHVLRDANRALAATNLTLSQDIARAVASLTADVRQPRQSFPALSSLAQVVQRHEDEIRSGKADATSRRHDTHDEHHRQAVDVWLRFDAFYDQHVRGLVNRLTRDLGNLPREEKSRRKASEVRRILIGLFPDNETSMGSPMDEIPRLLEPLGDDSASVLAELTTTAAEIDDAAAALGIGYLWAIDEEWVVKHPDSTEGWTGCTIDDLLEFVVRPAFAVAGKVIGTATLFTTPRPR
ncbi:hypothetical protein ABZ446_36140 [Streptomyces sp. NPDC005813]|uniref:hypothetical protein n=1 Tax=Streptomyces sp. NPDC005813 TaxID=3155592 RepID=UPI0033F87818